MIDNYIIFIFVTKLFLLFFPPSFRRYRAPECLLTDGYYNYKMDMWGIGCVFFEVMSLFPLFPGTNELDQIQKIHNIVGTPPPELLAKIKRYLNHSLYNFGSFLSPCSSSFFYYPSSRSLSACCFLVVKIYCRSVHMNFNFPAKEGTGIERLIPNAPADCVEIIKKLLAYNPDDR
jgi:renal tumor antigen